MQATVLTAGIACVIAAIIGGGLKAFGIEIPLLHSRFRQLALGGFGIVLILAARTPLTTPGPKIPIPSAPSVRRFDGQPSEIGIGQQSVLSWDAPGADTVTISSVGVQKTPTGSIIVQPSHTTEYTLTASNSGGSQTQTVTVRVHPVAHPHFQLQ